jgi:predicted lactoylglutathione lyase
VPFKTYVNLPVEDLAASKAFFAALGFAFSPEFSDEKAAGMIINDGCSYAMLLTKPFFQEFLPHKTVADSKATAEVLVALQCDSREEVDALVAKAVAAGGKTYREPQDHGFMYGHGFEDLDGHLWEVFHMSGLPTQPQ